MITVGLTEIFVVKDQQYRKHHVYAATECKQNGVGLLTRGASRTTAYPPKMPFI